jgi:DNA-directed RNA polymerase subunit RPC12/RpoP
MDINCTECGSSDWSKVLSDDYPEHRRERERTVKTVYTCNDCGAEGRHFEHQHEGTEQYSGAIRQ